MGSSKKRLKQYRAPKVKPGWQRRRVCFANEAPRIGCGTRLVDFRIKGKWVYVRLPYPWASGRAKFKLPVWETILKAKGNRVLEPR